MKFNFFEKRAFILFVHQVWNYVEKLMIRFKMNTFFTLSFEEVGVKKLKIFEGEKGSKV